MALHYESETARSSALLKSLSDMLQGIAAQRNATSNEQMTDSKVMAGESEQLLQSGNEDMRRKYLMQRNPKAFSRLMGMGQTDKGLPANWNTKVPEAY